jgi:GNAT superfamily N-acetyltransferase
VSDDVSDQVEVRRLARSELVRVADIDRTETIEVLYRQHGTELVAQHGNWNAPPWYATGEGEHTVPANVRAVERYVDAGGVALGAFVGDRMVGIGVVVPHVRPTVAQLAYLHVSAPHRAAGVGRTLCERLDGIARDAGDTEMVVSATPSENTVRFYLGRGFLPMAEPLAELFAQEPEDIHFHKTL